jgi:hypothetical protein
LREKRRLRVLRRIFGPKRAKVIWEWRKLHIEELNKLYSSPNIVRVIKIEMNEMGEACVWGRGDVYTGFWWGNLREKRLIGRPRHRWEDNIKDVPSRGGMWRFWLD